MLGSLILYLKAIRIVMFQLSGFYYSREWGKGLWGLLLGIIGTAKGLLEGSIPPFPTKHQGVNVRLQYEEPDPRFLC